MNVKSENNIWDKKRLLIESIIAIACALIGAFFGKASNTYYYNDERITKEEMISVMKENENLNSRIEELNSEKDDLEEKNESLITQLDDIPTVEFQNIGLSIDGVEQMINTDKSSVLINGNQYYSQEFVDNLLPEDKQITTKDDIFYIGKIVKEKSDLLEKPIVEKINGASIEENITDTYGNIYSKALRLFRVSASTTFNVNRDYSRLKCKICMEQGIKSSGIVQISTEQGIIYTSEELTNITEPYEIDLPINQASIITFSGLGKSSNEYHALVAEAVLYNEE